MCELYMFQLFLLGFAKLVIIYFIIMNENKGMTFGEGGGVRQIGTNTHYIIFYFFPLSQIIDNLKCSGFAFKRCYHDKEYYDAAHFVF